MKTRLGSKDVGLFGYDRNRYTFRYRDIFYSFETSIDGTGPYITLEYTHRIHFLQPWPPIDITNVFRHTDAVMRARIMNRRVRDHGMWLPDQTVMDWVDLSMPMPDELGVDFLPVDLSGIWAQVREMNIDPQDRRKLLTAIRLLL